MEIFNSFLCGKIMPALLIFLGVFFAFKLKFFYIFHPIKSAKEMLKGQKDGFKSLSVALAGTLGVGNIVGVASAISLGGAGSIFWMWVSAFCAMGIKYAEVYLAMIFRHENKGRFYGGAPYYIKEGLSNKIGVKQASFLSLIFAVFCVINSLTTGNLVQVNSVSAILPVSPLFFGIIFTVLTFSVISGGLKRISNITAVLIPMLSLIYILLCSYIIFQGLNEIPTIIKTIFVDAFSVKSASAGVTGYGIYAAIRYGVSRGVLSNEAGCGTAPAAHASSENKSAHSQSCLGIFEVFIDTILLCSLTAFVILLSSPAPEKSPMLLVVSAFEQYTGKLGGGTIAFLSISFAFATVICQYFYGCEALEYISNSKGSKGLFSAVFCLTILVGAIMPMNIMWQISDLAIAVMTIINLICLFLLRNHIK